jgi:hypothetical protein
MWLIYFYGAPIVNLFTLMTVNVRAFFLLETSSVIGSGFPQMADGRNCHIVIIIHLSCIERHIQAIGSTVASLFLLSADRLRAISSSQRAPH